jgi:CMP-N-acetylneuraminic acid synthetase
MLVLALVPARGGSKGVRGKNIREIAGKPLIAWTIESALASTVIDRIIVSTDHQEIADIAMTYGGEVPFARPDHLARDDTPDFPVYEHAMNWLSRNERYEADIVIWLRPTTPLRAPIDINASFELLTRTDADCVRSVCPMIHHPYWAKSLDGDRLTPFIEGKDERVYYQRQLLPSAYRLNGAVDVIWRERAMRSGELFGPDMRGYVMPIERSVDIDTELDFILAEILLQKRSAA